MLKDDVGDVDVVVKELRSVVADKIAKYAVPDQVLVSGRPQGPLGCCFSASFLLATIERVAAGGG